MGLGLSWVVTAVIGGSMINEIIVQATARPEPAPAPIPLDAAWDPAPIDELDDRDPDDHDDDDEHDAAAVTKAPT